MPKYLIQGSYSGEGLKGLLKEGGSKRREAAEQSVKGLGGRLEAFYYAFGNDPIEKDALNGPFPTEILARVAARMGEPDRAIAVLQKLLSIPYSGTRLRTRRSLPRCSGLIQCSIHSGVIRASKNSSPITRNKAVRQLE